MAEKFAFRSHPTRETSFSIDYDELYQLIHHEKEYGFIVWVLGPAVVFDRDAVVRQPRRLARDGREILQRRK